MSAEGGKYYGLFNNNMCVCVLYVIMAALIETNNVPDYDDECFVCK